MSRFPKIRTSLRAPGQSWASDIEHSKDPLLTPGNAEVIFNTYVSARPALKRPIFINLASNPNLELRLLAGISEDYPEYVAANAAVQLLLLENPNSLVVYLYPQCLQLLGLGAQRREYRRFEAPPDYNNMSHVTEGKDCDECGQDYMSCPCIPF